MIHFLSQVLLKCGPVRDTSAKFQCLLDRRSSIPPHAGIKESFQLQPILKTTAFTKMYAYDLKYMSSQCKRYGSKGVVYTNAYTVSFEMWSLMLMFYVRARLKYPLIQIQAEIYYFCDLGVPGALLEIRPRLDRVPSWG